MERYKNGRLGGWLCVSGSKFTSFIAPQKSLSHVRKGSVIDSSGKKSESLNRLVYCPMMWYTIGFRFFFFKKEFEGNNGKNFHDSVKWNRVEGRQFTTTPFTCGIVKRKGSNPCMRNLIGSCFLPPNLQIRTRSNDETIVDCMKRPLPNGVWKMRIKSSHILSNIGENSIWNTNHFSGSDFQFDRLRRNGETSTFLFVFARRYTRNSRNTVLPHICIQKSHSRISHTPNSSPLFWKIEYSILYRVSQIARFFFSSSSLKYEKKVK